MNDCQLTDFDCKAFLRKRVYVYAVHIEIQRYAFDSDQFFCPYFLPFIESPTSSDT